MTNWIYSNPTWLWGTLLVLIVTGLSCLGLAVAHGRVNVDMRRKQNDVTAAAMGIVGVAYAVLIAFIAVAAWESFTDADKIVDAEASFVGNLYRDTIGLSEAKAAPMRADIKTYLDEVIHTEFPAQRSGQISTAGRETLVHLHGLIATIDPTTPGETVIASELMHTINDLYTARRTRLLAAAGAVPEIVWWIIAFGTTLTIGFTYMFGAHDFRMHMATTAMVAASMSLVIVLIISLDRPFRGDLSVSLDAYENIVNSIAAAERPR